MDYKVNFKTKTNEWKTKYNKLIEDIPNILKPVFIESSISALVGEYKQFAFDLVQDDNNGLYLFTYGNCMILLPCYNLLENVEYKVSASLLNGEGQYSVRVLTYKIHANILYIYSKENIIPVGYTGYLFRIKLY